MSELVKFENVDCGCRFEEKETPGMIIGELFYCPLHAAAPAILEALEALHKIGVLIHYSGDEKYALEAKSRARKVLATARGDADHVSA